MELSRGTAYGVGLSQLAVTMGIVLFFQSVDIDVFLIQAHVNATTGALVLVSSTDIKGMRASLGLAVIMGSALGAIFSTMTYRLFESGLSGQDFQPDVMDQASMWDMIFWMYVLVAHGLVVAIIADPVDVYGGISCTFMMVYFLCRICAPKGQALNITQENLNMMGYCVGVLMMVYQVTDTRNYGASVVMLVVVVDYFLGVGHTYDRQATLDTVANCRLFYVCMGTLSTVCLYALSGSSVKVAPDNGFKIA
jgi:hypothetical protein